MSNPCPNCNAARDSEYARCPACQWRPRRPEEMLVNTLLLRIAALERRSRRLGVLLLVALAACAGLFAYQRWGAAFGASVSARTLAAERIAVERIELVDSLAATERKTAALTYKRIGKDSLMALEMNGFRLIADGPDDSRIIWPSGRVLSERGLEPLQENIRRLQGDTEVLRRGPVLNWPQAVDDVRREMENLRQRILALEAKK